jgi:hypothetical protein
MSLAAFIDEAFYTCNIVGDETEGFINFTPRFNLLFEVAHI